MAYSSITKTQICYGLGLVYSSGRLAYDRLKYFFTQDVLVKIGMDESEFKRVRRFNAFQSEIIMTEFDINPYEISNTQLQEGSIRING